MKRNQLVDITWLLFFGVVSSIWCLAAATHLGATFDEPTYLRCGLDHWHTGSYKQLMRLGTMPLAVDVQTLPVYLWERWRGSPVAFDDALRCARGATLVFWWMLLIYAFRAGKTIGGSWGGRIAVALLALEPVLLGHAVLATSDIAVTALLLVLVVEFRDGRNSAWPRRLVLPAILYGLAILAKASALVFGPIYLLTVEAERCLSGSDWHAANTISRETIRRSVIDLIVIMVGGLAVIFLYCGSDWTAERTFIEWAQKLPPGKFHDVMLWTAQHLKIFTNAGEGLAQQIKHNIRGHGTFILGREYPRAIWFYFPVALTIKSTLALLSLPVAIFLAHRAAFKNWALWIAGVLLLYSLTCRVQIGIRFMFPLIVCLCIGVGAAAAVALRQLSGWKHIGLTIWLVIGITSSAFAAIQVWPHGICYTNPAWGGTSNGYRLLSDSNYDWGQGLPDLRSWQQQHNVPEINVWYFGTDPSIHQAPLRELPLHRPGNPATADAVRDKLVAVSTTLLYGTYTRQPPARDGVAFFRSQQPIDRTMTFFIYDFRNSAPVAPANP